jgi:hypothetical protein
VAEIFTAALTADKITANEAFVACAVIPELYVTALKAVGDVLDISANESVKIVIGEAIDDVKLGGRNYMRLSRTMYDPAGELHGFVERQNIPVIDEFVIDTVYVV